MPSWACGWEALSRITGTSDSHALASGVSTLVSPGPAVTR